MAKLIDAKLKFPLGKQEDFLMGYMQACRLIKDGQQLARYIRRARGYLLGTYIPPDELVPVTTIHRVGPARKVFYTVDYLSC